jgi:hypothetical protein
MSMTLVLALALALVLARPRIDPAQHPPEVWIGYGKIGTLFHTSTNK